MSDPTRYDLADGIATITLDDGRVNALSSATIATVMARLDQAEEDGAVVVLTGREGTLSAGFDLRTPPDGWRAMVGDGARLAERLLAFPRPVVVACPGHAVAMGALTLLSCDVRVGAAGDFRIGLNEVAIGLTLPLFGVALAQHRLTAPAAERCVLTGALVDPETARQDGFLDELVAPDAVLARAQELARGLLGIDANAHAATKLRMREDVLARVRDGIERIADREPTEW